MCATGSADVYRSTRLRFVLVSTARKKTAPSAQNLRGGAVNPAGFSRRLTDQIGVWPCFSVVSSSRFSAPDIRSRDAFREEGSLESQEPQVAIALRRFSAATKWPALEKPTWWRSPKKFGPSTIRELVARQGFYTTSSASARTASGRKQSLPRRFDSA